MVTPAAPQYRMGRVVWQIVLPVASQKFGNRSNDSSSLTAATTYFLNVFTSLVLQSRQAIKNIDQIKTQEHGDFNMENPSNENGENYILQVANLYYMWKT
jgi:hypothetical protein